MYGHSPERTDHPRGPRSTRPSARAPAGRHPRPIALLLAGLLAVGVACTETPPPGRYNVIVISIDTLRADRLGAYGYERGTSPRLDTFAAQGALFEAVVAECSWTLPSHVTMLSGLYPSTHGAVLPSLKPGPEVTFLAELLSTAGYRTIGLTDGGYVGSAYGFSRGFDVFDDVETPFNVTLERARSEMAQLGANERVFMFLHTYDVHCPYTPSETSAARFRSPDADLVETEGRCGNPHYNRMVLTPGQVRHISDQYDAGILDADDDLGPFLDYLSASGHLDDTIVVITSDHGEEFREHGQIGHERSLYREVLMIPLVIVGPGVEAARIDTPIGLVDLAPTLLDLVELPVPDALEGVSRTGDLGRPSPSGAGGKRMARVPTERVSELDWQLPLRSLMTRDWHLILNRRTGRSKLYSVIEDPAEAIDLAASQETVVVALLDSLYRFDATRERVEARPLDELTPEQQERLRNLGYIN